APRTHPRPRKFGRRMAPLTYCVNAPLPWPSVDHIRGVRGAGGADEAASGITSVASAGQNVTACPHHGCEGGTATVDDGGSGMTDHNGVLMMQRALLAGTLGLAMARKAAAILEGDP